MDNLTYEQRLAAWLRDVREYSIALGIGMLLVMFGIWAITQHFLNEATQAGLVHFDEPPNYFISMLMVLPVAAAMMVIVVRAIVGPKPQPDDEN